MRSIANGSVEGFPDPSTVRTVFVEADILGTSNNLRIEYKLYDTLIATYTPYLYIILYDMCIQASYPISAV